MSKNIFLVMSHSPTGGQSFEKINIRLSGIIVKGTAHSYSQSKD